jgi:transcriptional regulator with GAF, ATPase, and Fis domain
MRALLTIETGQGLPKIWELPLDQPITLGRNQNNTIVVQDEHASRWHAEIIHQDSSWFLRDLGTLNGTKLNGERIQQQVPLANGQVISIGNTRLRFAVDEDEVPAPKTAAQDPRPSPPDLRTANLGPSPAELNQTLLCADELTPLCQFMTASLEETDPRALIRRALQTIHRQTGAAITGFLSLDHEDPLPKIVLPETARVDIHLSRQLTQAVQRQGQAVWLGAQADEMPESESLLSFKDALCLPLRAGDSPVGAIHVYRTGKLFTERDLRFCEVLAGHLAKSLLLLRVRRKLEAENSRLRVHAPIADQLIGDSPALTQLRQLIGRIAVRPTTVLVVGESGVGKELVALALHKNSPRREAPLVVVNCAAIAPTLLESELFGHCEGAFSGAKRDHPGLFQQADEGTLFLDEVGEMSLECQAKLLRVLEGKGFRPVGATSEVHVDVRIVAATNRDLQEEVKAGKFRHDLYFRLGGIQIAVPPLRQHVEDIPPLVDYFLTRLAVEWGRQVSLTDAALRRLQEYTWPGNVRQLRSVLENAVALSEADELGPEDLLLPAGAAANQPPSLNLEELEAWAIRQALRQTGSNRSQAARLLGIVRDTLINKIKKYGIEKDEE